VILCELPMQKTYRVHEEATSNSHKDINPDSTGYQNKRAN